MIRICTYAACSCDGCGTTTIVTAAGSEQIAATMLRADGWSEVRGEEGRWRNFCPRCTERRQTRGTA